MSRKVILSLCDRTGNWSWPYAADPAYEVVKIDVLGGHDIRLLKYSDVPVHGILAAPPCTHLCVGGAESWKRKGDAAILEAMGVVDACMRMVLIYRPVWWALENPAGRLHHFIGPYSWTFNPCDYGGYLSPGEKSLPCPLFPPNDCYTKKTCIWGTAKKPEPKPVPPPKPFAGKPDVWAGGNTWNNACFGDHDKHRSITPMGFSRAFREANP
jgi:hypothetical protein